MTNVTFRNVESLPSVSVEGCIYVLNGGLMFIGKSNGEFLQINKDYIDELIESLESTLTSTQRRINVVDGQTVIPINQYDYSPDTHIELLFDNTTKVFRDEYVISPSTDSFSGYEIVLSTPVSNAEEHVFELILIYGKALASKDGDVKIRFHDGAFPPTDRTLIWNKTS